MVSWRPRERQMHKGLSRASNTVDITFEYPTSNTIGRDQGLRPWGYVAIPTSITQQPNYHHTMQRGQRPLKSYPL